MWRQLRFRTQSGGDVKREASVLRDISSCVARGSYRQPPVRAAAAAGRQRRQRVAGRRGGRAAARGDARARARGRAAAAVRGPLRLAATRPGLRLRCGWHSTHIRDTLRA